jgi:17 kDa common-antigen outer membrane protein
MRGASSNKHILVPGTLTMAAMAMAIMLLPQASLAGNLSFLSDSVVSKFKPEDMKLLMDSVDKTLDAAEPHASGSWSNAKTGNSGTVAVTGQFTSTDGHACKNLNVLNRTPTMQGTAQYILCQVPGRGWLLNPAARPAQADAAVPPKQK